MSSGIGYDLQRKERISMEGVVNFSHVIDLIQEKTRIIKQDSLVIKIIKKILIKV
jgi:hypothetical protein